jgi:hypothetical protein
MTYLYIIAVCKKHVKTQINTISAQLRHETCEGHISGTTHSIVLISSATNLATSAAGPGALICSDFFIFPISKNSVSKPISPSLCIQLLKNHSLNRPDLFCNQLAYIRRRARCPHFFRSLHLSNFYKLCLKTHFPFTLQSITQEPLTQSSQFFHSSFF